MNVRIRFFSHTGLTRQIAILSAPLVLQNISQTLLGVVDTYFVSRIGTEALAATGLASILFFAVMMFFRSVANSTVVFVGRAYGAHDYPQIGVSIWRVLNLVGWLSLIVLGIPWFFAWLFTLFAPPDNPTVRLLGTQYLTIRSAEIPMAMFSAVVWGFLVGRGDSRTPMILSWIMVLSNIFLDWVLVLGNLGAPALGVVGAAYATVMAKGIEVILGGFILWSSQNRQTYKTGAPRLASWKELHRVLRIGLPMGVGDFIEIASFSAFFGIIGRIGTLVLAASQIALQYMSLTLYSWYGDWHGNIELGCSELGSKTA